MRLIIGLFVALFAVSSANADYTFDDFTDYGSFHYIAKLPVYSYEMMGEKFETVDEACKHNWDFKDAPYQGYIDRGENTWWCNTNVRYRTVTKDEPPYWGPMPYSRSPTRYHADEVCYQGWVYRVDSSDPALVESGEHGALTMYILTTYPTGKYCQSNGNSIVDMPITPPDEVDPDTGNGGVCFDDNWDEIPCNDTGDGDYEGGGGDTGGGGAGGCWNEDWTEKVPCDDEPDPDGGNNGGGDGGGNTGGGIPAPDGIASESTLSKLLDFFTSLFKTETYTDFFPDDNSDSVIDEATRSDAEISQKVLGTSSYSEYIDKSANKHKFNTAANCPSDLTLLGASSGLVNQDITYSYRSMCDLAIKVNPIVVAFGYLLSIFMIVRV